MRLFYGVPENIEGWMRLVRRMRWNFPGLETQQSLDEHRSTVLRFMGKRQAIGVKVGEEIAGVMLFSRGHNMICCLGVSPDYRRRGIASMLMEEALRNLDRTRDISVSTFRAEDEKGPAPRAFYEKYGFVADELVEELGYPCQRYLLHPADDGQEKAPETVEIHGANAYPAYSKTRVGCRGIIIQDGRMLISHEVNADYYLIPGGGLEAGETPEACCAREVREETGYLVRPTLHFLTLNEYYEEYRYVSHYFLCDVIGKAEQHLTANEAERGLIPEWVSPEDMLALYARHEDFAATSEEKRGVYQREYTALKAYFDQFSPVKGAS